MACFLFLLAITSLIFYERFCCAKNPTYESLAVEFPEKVAREIIGGPALITIENWKTNLLNAFGCDIDPNALDFFQERNHETIERFNDKKLTRICSELSDFLIPKMGKCTPLLFQNEYYEWTQRRINWPHVTKIKGSFPLMRHIQDSLCSQFHTKLENIERSSAINEGTTTEEQQEEKGVTLAKIEGNKLSVLMELKNILLKFLRNRENFGKYLIGKIRRFSDCVNGLVSYAASGAASFSKYMAVKPLTYETIADAFAKKAVEASTTLGASSDVTIQKWKTDLQHIFNCNGIPSALPFLQAAIQAAKESGVENEIEYRMDVFNKNLADFIPTMKQSTDITFKKDFSTWNLAKITDHDVRDVRRALSSMIEMQKGLCSEFCDSSSTLVGQMLEYQKETFGFMINEHRTDVDSREVELRNAWVKFIRNRFAFGLFLIGNLNIKQLGQQVEGFVEEEGNFET